MRTVKVVFMGTPEFAVPCLREVCLHHEVIAVITQPDKPKGRGHKMQHPPVKEFAVSQGITVLQPERIRNAEFVSELRNIHADVFIVVAYGQILSKEILDMPRFGCVNVHGSLLPELRGAAPIQWAVVNGDKKTGVTIMHMDIGIDTGDMILKSEMEISDDDTGGSVHDKMSELGAKTLLEALVQIESGVAVREKQDDSKSTHAPLLKKDTGFINWNEPSDKIIKLIKGLNPWPTAYTLYNGEQIKIWNAIKSSGFANKECGEIVDFVSSGFVVKTQDGAIIVTEIQVQGSKRMSTPDYLRGHSLTKNTILGK